METYLQVYTVVVRSPILQGMRSVVTNALQSETSKQKGARGYSIYGVF